MNAELRRLTRPLRLPTGGYFFTSLLFLPQPPPLFSTLYHYSFSLYYFPPYLPPSLPLPSSLSSPLYHYSLFALDFYPTPFSVLPTSFLVLFFSSDSLFTLYYFNFSHFFFNLYSLPLFFFSLFAHPPPTYLPPPSLFSTPLRFSFLSILLPWKSL